MDSSDELEALTDQALIAYAEAVAGLRQWMAAREALKAHMVGMEAAARRHAPPKAVQAAAVAEYLHAHTTGPADDVVAAEAEEGNVHLIPAPPEVWGYANDVRNLPLPWTRPADAVLHNLDVGPHRTVVAHAARTYGPAAQAAKRAEAAARRAAKKKPSPKGGAKGSGSAELPQEG